MIWPLRHGPYLFFLIAFVALLIPASQILPFERAFPVSFDVAAFGFISSCVPHWRKGDAKVLRKVSARDDRGRALLLLLTALVTVTVLGSLAVLLGGQARLSASDAALMVTTIVISWIFANLVLTYHYARLYYDGTGDPTDDKGVRGGLNIPGSQAPSFADFVNFSFVIGMTCQTADIEISSSRMRRVSTLHSVAAFFFNLGVLALTVNVVASAF